MHILNKQAHNNTQDDIESLFAIEEVDKGNF